MVTFRKIVLVCLSFFAAYEVVGAEAFYEKQDREKAQKKEEQSSSYQEKTYYDVFGISSSASDTEVTRAYKKLALKWHPDRVDENKKEAAEIIFAKITKIKECLLNPACRLMYDFSLEKKKTLKNLEVIAKQREKAAVYSQKKETTEENECPRCHESYKHASDLQDHMSGKVDGHDVFQGEPPYFCLYSRCNNRKMYSKREVIDHMLIEHADPRNGQKNKFNCPFCPCEKQFRTSDIVSKFSLRQHMNRQHFKNNSSQSLKRSFTQESETIPAKATKISDE